MVLKRGNGKPMKFHSKWRLQYESYVVIHPAQLVSQWVLIPVVGFPPFVTTYCSNWREPPMNDEDPTWQLLCHVFPGCLKSNIYCLYCLTYESAHRIFFNRFQFFSVALPAIFHAAAEGLHSHPLHLQPLVRLAAANLRGPLHPQPCGPGWEAARHHGGRDRIFVKVPIWCGWVRYKI